MLSTLLLSVLILITIVCFLKIYVIITMGRCTSKRKLNGKTVIVTGATSGKKNYIINYDFFS